MPQTIAFTKGHGTGNDFVIVPDPDGRLDLSDDQVAVLCDRRFGIGGDGILRVVRSSAIEEGAEAAASGIRCWPVPKMVAADPSTRPAMAATTSRGVPVLRCRCCLTACSCCR